MTEMLKTERHCLTKIVEAGKYFLTGNKQVERNCLIGTVEGYCSDCLTGTLKTGTGEMEGYCLTGTWEVGG